MRDADPQLHEDVKAGKVSLKKAAGLLERAERQAAANAYSANTSIPAGPFGVVLADPPWRLDFSTSRAREPEAHYPTMSHDELCRLDVSSRCASDCVLFLWATSPKLAEAIDLLRAWGFEQRTSAVWVKPSIGCGYYFQSPASMRGFVVGSGRRPG